ncbi:hypothetical protein GCM10010193_30270 [Kitasatospora atroaurantiaca]|uniref:Papain fold toxin 1 (Glutamine deamidase) of polymorphic toxin system n=1 Tax=Kitasatospora atroaurantiaca TaxID=285545 RepID=A0A561EQY8_9ACTN|nr:toxin glutamine deamidase domain-containing protein [Kitasatospora atroaurantiaca]TWE18015.1 papain fold toxin 1 (glutamine deamidase) of polymorphic toxin system [Kitasatospora atroaurantiaca]
MSRNLPEELVPVMAKVGHHWPEADEDGLRRAAGVWREFGGEAERLSRRGGDSAQRVTGENSGRAVDAFAEHWRGFAGGGRGALDDAQTAAELIAKAFESAATATDSCKSAIISVLTELAEEIKADEAAKAKAGAGGGVLGAVVKVVTTVVADVEELVAVTVAKARVGELLEELGREMKHGLEAALKEPAVTTLERIAQADGHGHRSGSGDLRMMSAGAHGQLTGALAGSAAGGAAVGGVRALSAKVGPDGRVVTDASGQPVLFDQNGKKVTGVEGVTVETDGQGKPVVGADGKVAVLGADGKPVVGLALGLDGKPMTDNDGKPVVVGADGKLGESGLSVAVGKDGKPMVGTDGRPVVVDADGKPVVGADGRVAKLGTDGRLVVDAQGHPVVVGVDGKEMAPTGHDQQAVKLGPDGRPVVDVNLKSGTGVLPGVGGASADGPGGLGLGVQAGPGGAGVQVTGGPQADVRVDDGRGHDDAPMRGHDRSGSGSGYGHQRQQPVEYDEPGGFDSDPVDLPRPSRGGPAAVHTDSVAVDLPPVTATGGSGGGGGGFGGGFGDAPSAPAGGGGSRPFDPPISGGSVGTPGGGYGPVSGAPVGAGPVGTGPVGGGSGAGVPGSPIGAGGAAGGSAPVAPGPVAGQTGVPGAGGTAGMPGTPGAGGVGGPGGANPPAAGGQGGAAVVGIVPGQEARAGAGAARPPVGSPLPGAGAGVGAGAGAGQGGPAPFRMFSETVIDPRRRPDGMIHPEAGGWAAVPPAEAGAAVLIIHTAGRSGGVEPASEPVHVRTIADSRPYGVPGGLGPVDPAHQAEAERRAPRTPEGAFALHPDPRGGDWTEALNGGGYREPGRANNCLDVALSGIDTFAGHPTCAAPRLPDGPAGERGGRDRAERELGTQFHDLGDGGDALAQLAETLLRSGPGAQAVLLTLDEFGRSHSWNAVSHGEAVTYLDHQTGRQSTVPLHDAAHGLWAIAVDAESRPLDLSDIQLTVPVPKAEPAQAVEAVERQRPAAPQEPAPPRSRLTIHRTAAGTSARSNHR